VAHGDGSAGQRFADLVAKYSNGQLTIKVFPASQLGTAGAMLEQISTGLIQVFPDALADASKWVPDVQYVSAPFLFQNRTQWVNFMHSDVVKGWTEQVRQKAGVEILGDPSRFMRGPYRVLVSTKPVNSVADIPGLKLRLPKDKLSVDVWMNLGASVQILDWSAVYDGLDRHMIDAMTSPISQLESIKVTEVAKHVVRTDEYWQSVAFFVNAKAHDALSPAVKTAVDRAYAESATYAGDLEKTFTDDSMARMKKAGVQFSVLDTKPLVQKAKAFYDARSAAGTLPKGFMTAVQSASTTTMPAQTTGY
jgi:TRAP-type C4-dicarboxylate transport system substrate-binding protein